MNGNYSLSSQDIPAVVCALGTLALAASMAVAIKWFISRDSKTEKAEDNEADLQRNQVSIEDGQSPRNGPTGPDEVPGKDAKIPQVSDGVELKLPLLPYDCQLPEFSRGSIDTCCISRTNVGVLENREQMAISFYGDISSDKRQLANLTPVSCKLSNVSAPECLLLKSGEAEVNVPALPPDFVDIKTNDTQKHVSTSLTHRCDIPYFERSENVQELVSHSETSSGNGEDMNVESTACQHELTGHDIVSGRFLQHRTVSMSLPRDTFNMDSYEKVRVLNCDSKLKMVNHTEYSVENKYNIWSPFMGKNVQHNIKIPIGKREDASRISESEGGIITDTCLPIYSQFSHGVRMKSDNATQLSIVPKFKIKNSIEHADGIPDDKQTTTTLLPADKDGMLANECCKDVSQHETFHFKLNTNISYRHQPDMGQALTDGKIKEVDQQRKASNTISVLGSVHAVEQNTTDKENIETENRMFFSSVKVFHDSHNEKYKEETNQVDDQIANSSQNHTKPNGIAIQCMEGSKMNSTFFHHNNSNVLQWSTTTVYNSTEHIDLMYPMDFQRQQCAEDNTFFSKNKKTCKDVFATLSFGRTFIDLDADGESSVASPISCNAAYDEPQHQTTAVNKLENILCDPSTLDTFNSKMVTKSEFVSSIKSMNNTQDNKAFHNWHKHEAEFQNMSTKECYTVITNGSLGVNHKCPDANSVGSSSKIYTLEDNYGKDKRPRTSKPLSALFQKTTLPIKEPAGWGHPFFCNVNTASSPAMMGTLITEQNQNPVAINEETNILTAKVSEDSEEQTFDTVDSLLPRTENAEESDLDKMCFSSNITCFEQDQQNDFTCCNFIPSHKEEEDKQVPYDNIKRLCAVKADDFSISRKNIMSTIAENPELILPEYQSAFIPKLKIPIMTKSCDNIHSGPSCQEPTLKSKAQSVLCLLTEYYSSKLHSLENGPVEEVARGSFICIPKGLRYIEEAKRFQVTLGNCLQLLKLARKNSVPELLKAVYTVISDNYLNVIKNSAIYGHLTGSERERILQLRKRGTLSLCIVETKSIFDLNTNIRCSVETDQAQCKPQLYSLDMESNQWKRVTSIPEEACLKGCSICSMHNYLFVAGGIQKTNEGSLCSNKLFCYNPLTDIWTQLTSMKQARSQLKLVPLDGYLYAIGGECLHTMERYDPRSNKWTFTAPLPKGSFAVAHEAVACGGEIYISGGHLFYRLLKYKPIHDQWEECPFNASKGRSCDMVAVGSILYRFDMYKDSTVNIFKYNTTAKMWSEYTAVFPGSKFPFRCAVLDDTIYCLNKETTARFSLDNGEALFESAIFSTVPTRGAGYPCPVVLYLRGPISQTSV